MRLLAIVLLACTCFGVTLWLIPPVAYADPGEMLLPVPSSPAEDNIAPDAVREFHAVKAERFVAVQGFGARRVISMFDMKYFPLAKRGSNELWELETIDVVGHVRTAPRTYMTQKIVSREKLNEIPTRTLDGFETHGLKGLREQLANAKPGASLLDESVQWRREGNRLRVLGSLRASKSCLECHKAREGELLGALSYSLRLYKRPPEMIRPRDYFVDHVFVGEEEKPASLQVISEPQGYLRDYQGFQISGKTRRAVFD